MLLPYPPRGPANTTTPLPIAPHRRSARRRVVRALVRSPLAENRMLAHAEDARNPPERERRAEERGAQRAPVLVVVLGACPRPAARNGSPAARRRSARGRPRGSRRCAPAPAGDRERSNTARTASPSCSSRLMSTRYSKMSAIVQASSARAPLVSRSPDAGVDRVVEVRVHHTVNHERVGRPRRALLARRPRVARRARGARSGRPRACSAMSRWARIGAVGAVAAEAHFHARRNLPRIDRSGGADRGGLVVAAEAAARQHRRERLTLARACRRGSRRRPAWPAARRRACGSGDAEAKRGGGQ